jgi:N-acetylneuraminic acid mutarotase
MSRRTRMTPRAQHLGRLVAPVFLLALLGCGERGPLDPRSIDNSTAGPITPLASARAFDVWATKSPMPTARRSLAVAEVNGALYAVGGETGFMSPVTTVEAYMVGSNSWVARASLPEPRSHPNAGVIAGMLYVAGGLDASGQPTNTLYAYSPSTNSWTTQAPMPIAGACGGSGVIDDRLYVFTTDCSESELGADPAFQRYDPATNIWTELPGPIYGHFLPAAGAVGGKFYLVGGLLPGNNVGQNMEAYDPLTGQWVTKAPTPGVRYETAGAVVNGLLYVVGGGTGTGYLATLQAYDPRRDSWRTLPDMPTARGFLGAAALGGKLYAVGGSNESGLLATNEAYTPARP